ncbi:tripartite tricarboxylate transporter substrate binding protein [Variovorax ginsengisoli]|uniref:Tripartite tricarboxylate transporter substrate binding protein n=2 Tax=Variovorax guangxiensis TaxID=1775474 RepID=A0A502DGT3_9BURK|nr:tripartite tricarboxylate transporter substrate-binding protein [Variovorax guangxiensis]TPG20263.1 tripartite tricarboxylate transporter substrate binding protein [Variovorax ginsengisoli]TPG23922.1 tripartite tricarboxylate transporter substrate binding protein [Variovorax guangxiensis]
MKSMRRSLLVLALAAATALPLVASAQSASWPTKPIRLIVGFPGGSTPDIAARTIAEPLSRALGQPVVVDNKPGASGNIAADQVAKATDDHTIGIVINGNLTSSKMLYPKLPYDPGKDFTYLSLIATAPLVVVAPNGLPSGAAFFEAARKAGDSWNYGSVGTGSVAHLGMELLKSRVPGFNPVHVPYQGNPQVVTAMLGGQVQLALIPPGVAMPQIRAGKLQAIGITSGRSTLVPELAPLADAGVKDFSLEVWTALLGPANLSKTAQDRISKELAVIMKSPEVRQRLFDQGWQAVGTSPEGMRVRVDEEAKIMSRIIQTRGIKLQ